MVAINHLPQHGNTLTLIFYGIKDRGPLNGLKTLNFALVLIRTDHIIYYVVLSSEFRHR
jgi:hypothetical protein